MLFALALSWQMTLDDSAYSTAALRALIADAATANQRVPAGLGGYRARIQTDVALIRSAAENRERVIQAEQVAFDAVWQRTGAYAQHVIGYRSRASTYTAFSVAALPTWTVPVLYGNRLELFFGPDTALRRHETTADTAILVHPLSDDRDAVYRFSGGDTAVRIRTASRTLNVLRIWVEPRDGIARRTTAFRGEMDLDATTKHIVRLKGEVLDVGGHVRARDRVAGMLARYVGYLELVNGWYDGGYWLPSYQRIDFHVFSPIAGHEGLTLRFQSRFGTCELAGAIGGGDSLSALPRMVTLATPDSLHAFASWSGDVGALNATARRDDFEDVAGPLGASTAATRAEEHVELGPARSGDLFRYNRVEGAFTGYGVGVAVRPDLTVQASGGWAWAERTTRGSVVARWTHERSTYELGARRSLETTNDFMRPYDRSATFAAFFGGVDDFDYVDRRAVHASATTMPSRGLELELGISAARDAAVRATVGAPFHADSGPLRPNRGVREGQYLAVSAALWHHGETMRSPIAAGFGAALKYEGAAGSIAWHRVEARMRLRESWQSFTYASSLAAGVVLGPQPPPQQLFEIGGAPRLFGYAYKEFGGDRAAVAMNTLGYQLPFGQTPVRIAGSWLPALAPAVTLSLQSGWTSVSSGAVRRSLFALGVDADGRPLSRPTGRMQSTVAAGVRFLGDMLFVGAARPTTHTRPWAGVIAVNYLL